MSWKNWLKHKPLSTLNLTLANIFQFERPAYYDCVHFPYRSCKEFGYQIILKMSLFKVLTEPLSCLILHTCEYGPVSTYACESLCVYVCERKCVCEKVSVCVYVFVCVCESVIVVCVCMCVHVCLRVCERVWIYACMRAFVRACMCCVTQGFAKSLHNSPTSVYLYLYI